MTLWREATEAKRNKFPKTIQAASIWAKIDKSVSFTLSILLHYFPWSGRQKTYHKGKWMQTLKETYKWISSTNPTDYVMYKGGKVSEVPGAGLAFTEWLLVTQPREQDGRHPSEGSCAGTKRNNTGQLNILIRIKAIIPGHHSSSQSEIPHLCGPQTMDIL